MSIIYDALKKVENSSAPQEPAIVKKPKPNFKLYFLYVLLACVGFFIADIFFKFLPGVPKVDTAGLLSKAQQIVKKKPELSVSLQGHLPSAEAPKKEAPLTETRESYRPVLDNAKKQPSPELTLNGVFFSQQEGYALINNRIVKKGDLVEGATVTRIELNEVELDFQGSIIKLVSK
ncbi:MAG: general secretion pathway protein GspB [Candidatus Omnitrophica bacterium]|nr:general secretion pathway protein GspB [Candidatus Omnitrophota bacterium]